MPKFRPLSLLLVTDSSYALSIEASISSDRRYLPMHSAVLSDVVLARIRTGWECAVTAAILQEALELASNALSGCQGA